MRDFPLSAARRRFHPDHTRGLGREPTLPKGWPVESKVGAVLGSDCIGAAVLFAPSVLCERSRDKLLRQMRLITPRSHKASVTGGQLLSHPRVFGTLRRSSRAFC